MPFMRRLFPALLVAIAATSAGAQEPAKTTKQPPALNADAFRLPPSAYGVGKFDYTPPRAEGGGFQPGRFDLGSSVLQLDTKRREPDTRVGIEAVEPSLLGGISKEDDSALPHYFGMTLSKPLN
jgi:hypothetical protein